MAAKTADQKTSHAGNLRIMAEEWESRDPKEESRLNFILRWRAAGMAWGEIADATGVNPEWTQWLAQKRE
jgi:hypothetical protein